MPKRTATGARRASTRCRRDGRGDRPRSVRPRGPGAGARARGRAAAVRLVRERARPLLLLVEPGRRRPDLPPRAAGLLLGVLLAVLQRLTDQGGRAHELGRPRLATDQEKGG